MSLMLISSNEVINLVFGVWLEVSFGLKLAALGAASAVIGISEISGESIGGVFRQARPRTQHHAGYGADAGGIKPRCLLWVAARLALIGLFFFYLSYEFTFVSTLPFMTELVPQARGTLLGANVACCLSLGRMIGSLVAPFVFTIGFWANSSLRCHFHHNSFWALLRAKKLRPA